jgi:hypothetical protein
MQTDGTGQGMALENRLGGELGGYQVNSGRRRSIMRLLAARVDVVNSTSNLRQIYAIARQGAISCDAPKR